MDLDNFFKIAHDQYYEVCPTAQRINHMLDDMGETIFNDHVAFRTFKHPDIGLEQIYFMFQGFGYEKKGEYYFKEKNLKAIHLEPENCFDHPKIFISELILDNYSDAFKNAVKSLLNQISGPLDIMDMIKNPRPWECGIHNYEILSQESEYASWLAAHGVRPNHFTLSLNNSNSFQSIVDLNNWLKSNDIKLNTSGGEVKGSESVFLEQSSTIADLVEVQFLDALRVVPGCYYEFAKRYKDNDGNYFQGFIETSANKIFESTNDTRK